VLACPCMCARVCVTDACRAGGAQVAQLVQMIDDGNRSRGGARKVATAYGVVGRYLSVCMYVVSE
jgi:hypothetical protein